TENPSLCRVKQFQKDEVTEATELESLCSALDIPFKAAVEAENEQEEPDHLILGPALLVREQRARAAQLYKSVVTWSLKFKIFKAAMENATGKTIKRLLSDNGCLPKPT
ncbi:hypothetical protein PHYSODRAFT_510246, partial [Phytophthora sojae]